MGGQFLSSYRWAHTRVRHPFPGGFHPFIVQALLLGRILFPAKSAWNRDSRQHIVSLIRVSIGTAHGPAHANGLGFFVGKGEIFQVLALPYVLLPTPIEDPYGAQSVHN